MSRWCLLAVITLAVLCAPLAADAQTVACGCSITTGELAACLEEIRALPADPLIPTRVVDDIFRTADGRDARRLTFATYLRGIGIPPGGTTPPPLTTCIGVSSAHYVRDACPFCNCPSCTPTICTAYSCGAWDFSDAHAHEYADRLDWKWWQVNRGTWESNWTVAVADGVANCPDINDVAHCSYNPVHGVIYNLGGDANKVAVFAVTDHTSNSCLEPLEWSVWLTDNPAATGVVRDDAPPDPMQWNRARIDQIFLQGWTRNPRSLGLATDTTDLTDLSAGDAQADSPTVVFSLPCGVTFRYASIVSGNYGNPGSRCAFHSSEDEVDAVAGLSADNTAICPDADGDGYRARSCGGGDCDDMDASVYPGALETCSTGRDVNCDGAIAMCPASTTCVQGFCATRCVEGSCASGFTCVTGGAAGSYCVPSACAGVSCPAGQICGPAGCQGPCDGARCPVGQVCRGGGCLDPCAGLACPRRQHCEVDAMLNGHCVIDCSCRPCTAPTACNAMSGRCEAPGCASMLCPEGQTLDCTGATPRCVMPCEGVTCPLGQVCSTTNGRCSRDMCFGVACPAGSRCEGGNCVTEPRPDAGPGSEDAGADGGNGGMDASDGAIGDGSGRTDARRDGSFGDVGGAVNTGPCGCRIAGSGTRNAPRALAAMLALSLALAMRRRRSR